jgi:hypothetical protein
VAHRIDGIDDGLEEIFGPGFRVSAGHAYRREAGKYRRAF